MSRNMAIPDPSINRPAQGCSPCDRRPASIVLSQAQLVKFLRNRAELLAYSCPGAALSGFLPLDQTLQEREVFFVAIRGEVQCRGNFNQLFFFNWFFMSFHQALVRPPGNSRCFHRIALRTQSDLMRMNIVQTQLVQERLLDNLVRYQEWLDPLSLREPSEGTGQMPVDEHRMSVDAIACDIRNIVVMSHD